MSELWMKGVHHHEHPPILQTVRKLFHRIFGLDRRRENVRRLRGSENIRLPQGRRRSEGTYQPGEREDRC